MQLSRYNLKMKRENKVEMPYRHINKRYGQYLCTYRESNRMSALKVLSLRLRGKRIMPPYKESLYALFGLKSNLNIEDNYICQNARVA